MRRTCCTRYEATVWFSSSRYCEASKGGGAEGDPRKIGGERNSPTGKIVTRVAGAADPFGVDAENEKTKGGLQQSRSRARHRGRKKWRPISLFSTVFLKMGASTADCYYGQKSEINFLSC